jgi:O-antigen biosynthesis protein
MLLWTYNMRKINFSALRSRFRSSFFPSTRFGTSGTGSDSAKSEAAAIKPGRHVKLDKRDLFDAEWYLTVNKDVAGAGIDPFQHFLAHGEAEGRNPSNHFSTTFYRETYMAGESRDASALDHFIRVGRSLGFDPNPDSAKKYAMYTATQEQSYSIEIPDLLRHIDLMPIRPVFVVYAKGDEETVKSQLRNQIYDHWLTCKTKDEVSRQLRDANSEPVFLLWLERGDILHSSAFYCLASAINARQDVDVLYGDEDEITGAGVRSRPFYKPDWSPDYLESCNFLGSSSCVRREIVQNIFGQSDTQYDFLLRATELSRQVFHIRKILLHRTRGLRSLSEASRISEEVAAIEGRLTRTGRLGKATANGTNSGCYTVGLIRQHSPLISMVIPTAGKIAQFDDRKVDLIFNCIDTIISRSTYKNLELVVIDNGDLGSVRTRELRARGAKIVTYREREINIAKKINLGVSQCRGDFLLLLNDDIEPLVDNWIEKLLEHFEKPHVGVVGAKLLYPDMTTQHLGVVIVDGKPSHHRKRYPRDDPGYFFSSSAARNYIAVTGAVMMTRTSVFRQVGGYTEDLAMNYNDIDYCLKIGERGLFSVFEPQAELLHHESISRPAEVDQSEIDYLARRWANIVTDPYFNDETFKSAPPNFEVDPRGRPIG